MTSVDAVFAAINSTTEQGKTSQKPDNDQVHDYAKKCTYKNMKGKKREPQIRYVYTHIPGADGGVQKTAVLKKVIHKNPPKDLIQMLVEKKQMMYAKEQKMKVAKESEDIEYKASTAEYMSSDEEDIEENFGWYKDNDPDSYFTLCTRTKNFIE